MSAADPTASLLTSFVSGPWPKVAGLFAAAVMAYGSLKSNTEELKSMKSEVAEVKERLGQLPEETSERKHLETRMAAVETDVKQLQKAEAQRDTDIAGLRGDVRALADQNRRDFDWLKRELDKRGGR